MFKGDHGWRRGVVFLQGHDGEFTFVVKHGLLMGTSEAPRLFSWSFDKTFKRWKLKPPDFTAHDAGDTFRRDGRNTKVDGSWSGFADDLFIKDVLPDHTADSAKDVILNDAESLDNTLAEGRYKQNLPKFEIVPSIRRLERSWVEQGTSEADTTSTEATKRKSSAD